ncbi:MAG: hypothetical protein AAGA55_07600, partial [Planctomycetota bacterium]
PAREPAEFARAAGLLRDFGRVRPDGRLLLDGPGDPLRHPAVYDLTGLGDEIGLSCVSLRTDLLSDRFDAQRLASSGIGVLTVDLLCTDAPTYAALTGVDGHGMVMRRIDEVASARELSAGLNIPWILPRMTKCEAAMDSIEAFYDAWIMTMGSAVIDPVPAWSGDRIRPLPIPDDRSRQLDRNVIRVRSDGAVCDARWRSIGDVSAFDAGFEAAFEAWRAWIVSSSEQADVRAGSAA